MNQKTLSKEAAETIEGWVKRSRGRMIRMPGYKCQISIEGIDSLTTVVLEEWLELGANVFFAKGLMNIGNWPSEERVFEVRMEGNVMAEGIAISLRDAYSNDAVISVKEK